MKENAKDLVTLEELEVKWSQGKDLMTNEEREERLRLTRVIEARNSRLSKKYDTIFYLDLVDHIFDTLDEKSKLQSANFLMKELQFSFREKIREAGNFVPKSLQKHV